MKKKVLIMLLSAVLIGSLTACGNNDSGKTAATTTTEKAATTEKEKTTETAAASNTKQVTEKSETSDLHFEIVSKGFQHQYWKAVLKGSERKAEELGVTINFVGPNTESDIADQIQMLNNAINAKPDAIGFAALDTSAALDSLTTSMDAGIPIIGFDSGVPNAPEGSILATCATDNYAAGELAAEKMYEAIADRIANASGTVRIGVLGQDATSESITQRGLGFIDKIMELIIADGKTVNVEGNDKYVSDAKGTKTAGGDVVIEVLVPAQATSELSAIDCQTLLNKADTIAIFGSNQNSGQAMVTANENIGKFGTGENDIIGVTFDSGKTIKGAVADGTFLGAVTQAPIAMGEALVQQLYNAATGATVEDVDTGCQWYTADNMDSEEIADNLYD